MTDLKKVPVLILNASFEPISISSAKRALISVCKGVAVVEQVSSRTIRTGRMSLPVPSVIRLLTYRRVPRRNRMISRKSILARDKYTCQYCNRTQESGRLTLDHIMPRSRNGGSTWENLVAACKPCNHFKSDRTPEEAGMPLLRRPLPFSIHTSRHLLRESGHARPEWRRYLYYESATTDQQALVS